MSRKRMCILCRSSVQSLEERKQTNYLTLSLIIIISDYEQICFDMLMVRISASQQHLCDGQIFYCKHKGFYIGLGADGLNLTNFLR